MRIGHIAFSGLIVALAGLNSAVPAVAQTRNTGGGNTGNTNSSLSGNSSSAFGNSGSMFSSTATGGSSGFGSTGTGSTGFGQTGSGQTGFGQTGQAGANRNGTGQGANGFLGANNNPNSFLGRNTQGQNAATGNQGQGNRGGGQRGMDQNLQNILNGGQNGNQQQNRNAGVRPRQKIAFDHPSLQTPVVVTEIQTRFVKMSTRYPHLKNVEFGVEDKGVVVLRGTVDSAASAKVTEALVRIEPGVKTIRNELSYPPPAAAE